jgi:hypothetical protein
MIESIKSKGTQRKRYGFPMGNGKSSIVANVDAERARIPKSLNYFFMKIFRYHKGTNHKIDKIAI